MIELVDPIYRILSGVHNIHLVLHIILAFVRDGQSQLINTQNTKVKRTEGGRDMSHK